MLRENAIRTRINRLLSGNYKPYEVSLLFADLRFLPHVPAEVSDLAHFAAHRHERNKGHALDRNISVLRNLEAYLSGRESTWSANSGYSDSLVVAALETYLIATGLASEISGVSSLKRPVALYGLASMHGCVFKPKGEIDRILAIRSGDRGTLEIGCFGPMPTMPSRSVNLCIFSTSVGIDTAIGRLRNDLPPSDPLATVELTQSGQLAYIE